MFKGRCDKVKLKKYNKKKYQDMVRGGVNKSILSRSHPLNVEAARVGNQKLPLRLVTKGRKKLLFVYAK
ncbi:MAG: hypothetical protein GY822_04520 [Deltaproteobacteria bacterium]|nr:hypothetical protein [Deltaproteobacteria bacterium]